MEPIAAQSGWTAQTSGTTETLVGVTFLNADSGWAAGLSATILHTTDGGTTWSAQNSGTGGGFNDVEFSNPTDGWAVGGPGLIVATTDGGATWNTQASPTGNTFVEVAVANAATAWAVSAIGAIAATTDSGSNWNLQTTVTSLFLQAVTFIDSVNGWVVGDSGVVLATIDGGATWNTQSSGTTQSLRALDFTDNNTGWAAGDSGTIITTTDGGVTWNPQTSGTTRTFWGLDFINATTGWAVGDSGMVLATTNGGATWSAQSNGTTMTLWDISMVNAVTGWIVGTGGTILKTSSGGFPPVNVSLPALSFGLAGDTITVPIQIDSVTAGVNPVSMNMTLLYPDSILNFLRIDTTGFLIGGFSLDTNTILSNTPGVDPDTLILAAGGTSPITTDGVLLNLIFTVDSNSIIGDTTTLVFEDLIFNEGVPALGTVTGGLFQNAQLHLIGDADGDGVIQANDASLVLKENVRKFTPADSSQILRMDASGNGTIRAFDAGLILQFVAGINTIFPAGSSFIAKPVLPALPGDMSRVSGNVSPELQMHVDDNRMATLTLSLTGINAVTAAELLLEFDPDVFTYLGYTLPVPAARFQESDVTNPGVLNSFQDLPRDGAQSTSPNFTVETATDNGILRLAMASPTAMTEDGSLVQLRFRVNENIRDMSRASGNVSPEFAMRLTSLYLNESQILGTDAIATTDGLPITYDLSSNFPNPFNPSTTIRYQVPEDARVTITIYNLLGQAVATLVDEQLPAGFYRAVWDGRNTTGLRVASGVYIFRMEANQFIRTRKMLLLK